MAFDPSGFSGRIAALVLAGAWCVPAGGCHSAGPALRHGPGAPTAADQQITLDLGNQVTLKLVRIPAGTFLMGSPNDEKDRGPDEGVPADQWTNGSPRRRVTISRALYMGACEVTGDQYAQFVKETGRKHDTPAGQQPGAYPVLYVGWDDAQAFCGWLSGKTGRIVRLPTEAEWEYACRAGSQSRFCFGDKEEDLHKYANYGDQPTTNEVSWQDKEHRDGFGNTAPAGSLKPNAWGLYDMHGNVWEWCSDWYATAYTAGDQTDPTGPATGTHRVMRGGSFQDSPQLCRSAHRNRGLPSYRLGCLGFRVVVVSKDAD